MGWFSHEYIIREDNIISISEFGLFQFNQRIKLVNMSTLLQQTLQKSVIQRIMEEYK